MSGITNTGRVPQFEADYWEKAISLNADKPPVPPAKDSVDSELNPDVVPTSPFNYPRLELDEYSIEPYSIEPSPFDLWTKQLVATAPPFEDQNINLGELWSVEDANKTDLIDGLQKQIDQMPWDSTSEAFLPWCDQTNIHSPIHQWLELIASKFIINYNEKQNEERINFREQFINQLLCKLSVTHAHRNPTFFPCLELALRGHLFNKIAEFEKEQIVFILSSTNKFPDDLAEREAAFLALITRNGFFANPNPCFFYNILPDLQPWIASCVSKNSGIDSTEALIEDTLRTLNLIRPSLTSQAVNFLLRQDLVEQLLTKQNVLFKDQFQRTGIISLENFNDIASKIYKIYSKNGNIQFYPDITCKNIKYNMLVSIFDLNPDFTFEKLRNQIEAEKKAELALPEPGFLSFLSSSPVRSARRCQLLDDKLATIAWAEREWISLSPPVQDPVSFAPVEISREFAGFIPDANAPSDPNSDQAPSSAQVETIQAPPVNPPVQDQAPSSVSDSVPAVKSLRPPAPLPQSQAPVIAPAPQMPEAPRIYSDSFNIPLVSYINIAFASCLQASNDDAAIWNSLPALTRRDALRHCYYLSNYTGKAEQIAARLFKTVTEVSNQLSSWHGNTRAKTRLSPAFVEKGEALLEMYYSSNRTKFYQEFQSLPKENLFYQYVYEMAKEAGVHIEPWDHNFAENNWNKVTMKNLSVQALERCLHTDS